MVKVSISDSSARRILRLKELYSVLTTYFSPKRGFHCSRKRWEARPPSRPRRELPHRIPFTACYRGQSVCLSDLLRETLQTGTSTFHNRSRTFSDVLRSPSPNKIRPRETKSQAQFLLLPGPITLKNAPKYVRSVAEPLESTRRRVALDPSSSGSHFGAFRNVRER